MKKSDLRIKLFADGADAADMRRIYAEGLVSGFTTNPSLMKKAGVTDYVPFAKSICDGIRDLPLSFEVFSDDLDRMEQEARTIAAWGDNVYVKIPVTNTKGIYTLPLIERLSADGIKVNVTAILTLPQVERVVAALTPGTGAYVSIFAGRIADTGIDPVPIMRQAASICRSKPGVESLWASTREVLNIIQAQECSVDIITVTSDILKKISMIGKDNEQLSLETVQMFYRDAVSLGYQIV